MTTLEIAASLEDLERCRRGLGPLLAGAKLTTTTTTTTKTNDIGTPKVIPTPDFRISPGGRTHRKTQENRE